MDRAEAETLQERLERAIREGWGAKDSEMRVSSLLHADNKIDVTVISRLFEGMDALEREAAFWPAMEAFSRSDRIHMTYCLLLTPGEAERHFARPAAAAAGDNWGDA